MKAKLLKLLVVLVWLVTPSFVRAQFNFSTNGNTLTLTAYTGSDSSVVIPANTNGYTIGSIGAGAFQGNLIVTNVLVPNTVTNIGNNAFVGCPNLAGVYFQGNAPTVGTAFSDPTIVYYLPNTSGWGGTFGGAPTSQAGDPDYGFSVTGGTIQISSYFGTNLQVSIPSSFYGLNVTSLGSGTFNPNRAVTNIILPQTLTNISVRTFLSLTNLTSITIPASLVSLGNEVFLLCTHLTNITVDASNPLFSSAGGVLFNKTQTKLVQYPPGLGTSYTVPNGVLSLGYGAFESSLGLTNVNLPNGLTNIDQFAFFACSNLVSVPIPNSVQAIGARAFSGCASLLSVNIPNSLTNFVAFGGNDVFLSCFSLTNIAVNPANPTYSSVSGILFDKAQQNLLVFPPGRGGSYAIPSGVLNLTSKSFNSCVSLTDLIVASSVTNLELNVFSGSGLTAIYFQGNAPAIASPYSLIPATAYYLPGTTGWSSTLGNLPTAQATDPDYDFAVTGDTIRLITYLGTNNQVTVAGSIFGLNVTSLGSSVFSSHREVMNVILPPTLTNISTKAFSSCTNLTSMTIPANLVSLGDEVFFQCFHLTNITVDASNPVFSSAGGVLFNKTQTKLIQYPPGLGTSYTVPNGVLSLGYGSFEYSLGLTNVNLPNGLTNIDQSAFFVCSNLVSMAIPNSVQAIGFRAFSNCRGLRSINIPDSLTNAFAFGGNDVFLSCLSLTNIAVSPANPTYSSVGGVLFDKAQQNLLVFPPGRGGGYTVPSGVLNLTSKSFNSCVSLTNLIVPASVTNLEFNVFSGSGLTAIYFQGNAPAIASPYSQIPATAYYLPGTTGWSSTLGDMPAVALTYPDCNFTVSSGAITISQYTGSETQPVIPASIAGLPVTSIGSGAFQFNGSIKSVTIPGSITNIGNNAFVLCSNLNAVYFLGNAPTAANSAFSSPAVCYYLPGKTGWGANLGGVPAVLWNPQPSLLAVTNAQFGFNITGPAGVVIVVEACTNLANAAWSPVSTNTLTGGNSSFSDPQWTNFPGRYYRLRSP
jgi:hypothetical protein